MRKLFRRHVGFTPVFIFPLFWTLVVHADMASVAGSQLVDEATAVVSAVGPDSRTWEISGQSDAQSTLGAVSGTTTGKGNMSKSPSKRHVVELETGMNFWDGAQWSPSDPTFEDKTGWFVADKVQHKVRIFKNINVSSAVRVTTPDGIDLESTPLAIGLYDPTSGDSAIIARITNSAGVMLTNNQVIFQDAFDAVHADIVYTLEKGTFAQDIVLTADLNPTHWGFSTNSEIQIITEFYKSVEPDRVRRPIYVEQDPVKRANMRSPDLVDTTLGFGQFVFGLGKAYAITETNTLTDGALVAKDFVTVDGREFLIESVGYRSIRQQLSVLTNAPQKGAGALYKPTKFSAKKAYASLSKPKAVAPNTVSKRVAKIEKRAGVVIDYIATLGGTLAGTQTFSSDQTICVSGAVLCNGDVIIEGGTVFKYKNNASLIVNGSVTFATTQYSPAIFTSIDDDSVGDTMQGVPGYTPSANATNRYANPALLLNYSPSTTIKNLRFNQCKQAISFNRESNTLDVPINILDCQLVNCVQGISVTVCVGGCSGFGDSCAYPFTVETRNTLVSSVGGVFGLQPNAAPYISLTHCTLDNVNYVYGSCGVQLSSFNSIFANVTNYLWGGSLTGCGCNNGFYNASSFGDPYYTTAVYPFQSNASGKHYLASGSNFRGVGNPGITSDLVADLRTRTTYPPVGLPTGPTSGQLTLSPQVQRYQSGPPDLGYYYPALDYVVGGLELLGGAAITVNPGTVVGIKNHTTGFYLDPGSSFTSQGRVGQPVTYVGLPFVQEDPGTSGAPLYTIGFCSDYRGSGSPPSLNFRFSNFYLSCNDYHFCAGTNLFDTVSSAPSASSCMNLIIRDSQLHGGRIGLGVPDTTRFSGSGVGSIAWTNNLFERVYINFNPGTALNLPVYAYNNLFWRGVLRMTPSQTGWVFRDNLFDQVPFAIASSPSIDCNYNAYWQATSSQLTAATNSGWASAFQSLPPVAGANSANFATAPAYQTSFYGNYYIPTNSITYNRGSRSPSAAGLYHYTTSTNQVKEGSKTGSSISVDIGLHYVATDPNGQPVDSNTDATPDYIADANGNGAVDAGETPWMPAAPVISVQPVSQSIARGGNVTLSVVATGIAPLSYQWWFNGGPIPNATNSTYSITGAQTNNAGTYYVVVANSYGTATSYGAVLAILPYITTQPNNINVSPGGNVTFTVVAGGTPPLSYQWRLNGATIPGATNTSYSFTAQAGRAGNYSVVVSSPWGTVISANALLTILGAPSFTSQPQSLQIPAGSTASFWVGISSTSTPPISYRWYRDGTPLTNSDTVLGATNSALLVYEAVASDSGSYRVQVSNIAGTVTSSNAVLTVITNVSLARWHFDQYTNWWRGDGDATDCVGGINGTVYGTVGYSNQAFSFNGQAGYVSFGQSAGNFGTNNFTIDFWIQTTAQSVVGILGKRPICNWANMWDILMRADGSLVIELCQDESMTYATLLDVPTVINDGIPHHVVISRVATTLNVEVDSVLITTETMPGLIDFSNTATLMAGRSICTDWDGTGYFSGLLDEIKLISDSPYVGERGQQPVLCQNVYTAPGWVDRGVLADTSDAALLSYKELETNGLANIVCKNGSIRFWFNPDWNSANFYGWGPQCAGRFVEIGTYGSDWWALLVNPSGTQISFVTQTNRAIMTNVTAGIQWAAGQWHQVVLTYSRTNSCIYLDGVAVATNGAGVTYWPRASIRSQGFSVGADSTGVQQIRGTLDELETFNYPLDPLTVANGVPWPVIVSQPLSVTANQGSTVSFSVTAGGGTPLAYQWKFNNTNITGATQSTFTRTNVQNTHQGNYSVQVSNAAGRVTSSIASLIVTVLQVWIDSPAQGEVLK